MNIIILTNSYLRHKSLVLRLQLSKNIDVKAAFYEKTHPLKSILDNKEKSLIKKHLLSRDVSEKDTFSWFIKSIPFQKDIRKFDVERGWFSSEEALLQINNINPDLILVYGTSIIKGKILEIYKGRIINIHLGLSPYYRGSGTNFFPFVYDEPEFCGASFLLMDSGVDTGKIIHQIRPDIYEFDSFHQLSNRFLLKTFDKAEKLIENFNILDFSPIEDSFFSCSTRKVFKNKDFSNDSVRKLQDNFSNLIIENYLSNKNNIDSKVPIYTQECL